ncbi:MAG: hypothetical protein K9H26_18910, partial [Prolixibacteraceae bacterium]|nr:hypothetical protein [Prolixibacteraceae bacterium]
LNKNTYKDEEKTTNYLIWGSLYFAQSKMLNYNDIQLRLTAIASWRREMTLFGQPRIKIRQKILPNFYDFQKIIDRLKIYSNFAGVILFHFCDTF